MHPVVSVNGGGISSERFTTLGSNNALSVTNLQGGLTLRSIDIHTFNNPLKPNYNPSVLAAGQLGFEIAYTGGTTATVPAATPWG
jgi:hypothetical protein